MKQVSVIATILFFGAVLAREPEVVSKLQRCENKNSECLTSAVQDAIGVLVNGIPEFDLRPLDPFLIEVENVEFHVGPSHSRVIMKNVHTYGISKVQILAVRSTPREGGHHLEIDVNLPRIYTEGDYKFDGRLAEIQLGGKGFFNISMTNVTTTWNLDGPVNNDKWTVEHFIMLPEVGDMRVYFDDLFNGNDVINEAARNFINQYWQLFYREMLPFAARSWDPELSGAVNKFFDKVSYSKFF